MAIRRCAWCGKTLGLAPEVSGNETTGVCPESQVRLDCEDVLSHALVGVRAIEHELERALAQLWPERRNEGGPQ